MMAATPDDKDATALSHTPPAESTEMSPSVDNGLDLLLMKKKKKKKKVEDGADGEADVPAAADAHGADGALDISLKKKKKKKAAKDDDFIKKLVELELKEGGVTEAAIDGDMDKGTGIWAHQDTQSIPFNLLLDRLFRVMAERNPDHAQGSSKSYKIPPPQCLREGNKKTIFANIADICKRMKRTEEHVTMYLFAELGTSGSTDGSRRLVIKGRFQQKQIENVLRKYIIEYVTCKTCKAADTELSKGENRLYFITCNSCGSRRSVTAIKTGFSAQIGKRKKMT